jgi:hypothetical protein
MKRIIPRVLLLALVALPALAKEPITHADVWLMKRIGTPLVSPDGKLVVFHKANHWVMRPHDARYYWEQLHGWLEEHLSE